jgi:prolipoprotein diacylglyceryltransferase
MVFSARFFIEFVKEIQVDFEAGMALNMGQILSIPFVVLGIYLITHKFESKPFQPVVITKPKNKPKK